MSMVCTVCQDQVTERPQSLPEAEELSILGMQCGHIFHRCCISEWFNKGSQNGVGNCPCCKKFISVEQGLRLYPSGDEDGQAIADQLRQAKGNMEELVNTRDEMSQLQMVMEDMGKELEQERKEHESLKIQHAESLSETDELRRQVDEQKRLRECLEQTGKVVIEKLEKEKVDAITQLQEMQNGMHRERIHITEHYETKVTDLEQELRELREYAKNQKKVKVHGMEQKETCEQGCQTDGRDAALLQARLVSYKSCLLHMQSEVRLLEREYDKVRQLQPMDDSDASFLMNEALNKSMDFGDGDTDRSVIEVMDASGDPSVLEDKSFQDNDASVVELPHDDSPRSSINEEFSDAPEWATAE